MFVNQFAKEALLLFLVSAIYSLQVLSKYIGESKLGKPTGTFLTYEIVKNCSVEIDTRGGYWFLVRCSDVSIVKTAPFIPANVTHLIFSSSEEVTLLETLLSHVGSTLTSLTITKGKLRFITSNFLKGLDNLKVLNLRENNIFSLNPNFLQFNPKIEELDISANILVSVKKVFRITSSLNSLRKLDLKENKLLENLYDDDFNSSSNYLEFLDISNCQIRNVSKGVFVPLPNLKTLIISENIISRQALENLTYSLKDSKIESLIMEDLFIVAGVPTKALSNLKDTNIREISLRYVSIPVLQDYAFPELPSLKSLNLRSCKMIQIYSKAFANLPNLEELYLSFNYIKSFTGIVNLKNLVKLDLSSNQLKGQPFIVQEGELSGLSNLKELLLTSCVIGSPLLKTYLNGLYTLEVLYFDEAAITHIEAYAFQELTNLTILNLSDNRLRALETNTFYGLKNLKTLSINSNILSLDEKRNPFSHLSSLEVLSLKKNRISILPAHLLTELEKLEIVFMNKNYITNWTHSVFPINKSLYVIDLSSNAISSVSSRMLLEFAGLSYLRLKDNPLNCMICEMVEFQEWLLNSSVDKDKITCLLSPNVVENIEKATNISQYCVSIQVQDYLKLSLITSLPCLTFIFLVALVGYKFRWYLRYWSFLINIRVHQNSPDYSDKPYVYDAFLSYSNEDSNWVINSFLPVAESCNLKLCLHQRDFEVGVPITENILQAIEECEKTVIVLTKNYVKSEWCMLEMHMAQQMHMEQRRDGIVLIKVCDISPQTLPKHIRYLLNTRATVTWTDDPQKVGIVREQLEKIFRLPKGREENVSNFQKTE